MPTVTLTKAEQQRLVRMIQKELNVLDQDKRCEKYYRDVYVRNLPLKEERTLCRKQSYNRDFRTTEKITKRVTLLKKIKQA